jgi:hypothetical protein
MLDATPDTVRRPGRGPRHVTAEPAENVPAAAGRPGRTRPRADRRAARTLLPRSRSMLGRLTRRAHNSCRGRARCWADRRAARTQRLRTSRCGAATDHRRRGAAVPNARPSGPRGGGDHGTARDTTPGWVGPATCAPRSIDVCAARRSARHRTPSRQECVRHAQVHPRRPSPTGSGPADPREPSSPGRRAGPRAGAGRRRRPSPRARCASTTGGGAPSGAPAR